VIFETDTGRHKFAHLNFMKICENEPWAILPVFLELFDEIAKMPSGNWFIRTPPEIIYQVDFDTHKNLAQIRCRFSVLIKKRKDPKPSLLGFPKCSHKRKAS
jgi:hypothetical protein